MLNILTGMLLSANSLLKSMTQASNGNTHLLNILREEGNYRSQDFFPFFIKALENSPNFSGKLKNSLIFLLLSGPRDFHGIFHMLKSCILYGKLFSFKGNCPLTRQIYWENRLSGERYTVKEPQVETHLLFSTFPLWTNGTPISVT